MKILIVTPFKNYPGGVEKMNSLLEKVFLELGHSVDYLTTENEIAKTTSSLKIKLFGLPAMTANAFNSLEIKYDLVVCNGEFGLGINSSRCINIFHGSFKGILNSMKGDLDLKSYFSLSWQSILQRKASENKFVITVSEYCKEVLEQQGISVDLVIQNLVDTEIFKPSLPSEQREGYLFVGKYNYKGKGIDTLEKLNEKFNLPITCVTNIKPKSNLKWIDTNGLKNLENIYNQYRILIFPSLFESSGLVALEAMACGVPVVMNRVGCAIELEKDIPEFVCNSNSIEEYDRKIKEIEENYSELSIRAREFVLKNHSKEQFKNAWKNVLEKIC
jgi:glycosyltransferase involved in cell wall biosynthesis